MQDFLAAPEWDPLLSISSDSSTFLEDVKRKEIRNIVRSYTGFYDLFAELVQNSLDAVDQRTQIEDSDYHPALWIHIDIPNQLVSVTDNGVGLSREQLPLFLQPNLTFKHGTDTRGNKGVGATFLAYGFNYIQIATKVPDFEYVGTMIDGRRWVEDRTASVARPVIRASSPDDPTFASIDRGASFTVKLIGENVKPKDLGWIQASTAEQWDAVLRIKTPLGGIYLFNGDRPRVHCNLKVTSYDGSVSEQSITDCQYYYPTDIPGKHRALQELMAFAERASQSGKPPVWPAEYTKLTSIYGAYTCDEILSGKAPVKPALTQDEVKLMRQYRPDVAVYFMYSVQFWDHFNDETLKLRQKLRILRGGLQLATQNMVQGDMLQIPLTFGTGYQNTTLVIVQFQDAEPDLGRKGFQPELVELAQKLAVASVNAFKHWYNYLKKDSGEPIVKADADRHKWIVEQEEHARTHPLSLNSQCLYDATSELPIVSTPVVEQDVVALFNQLLAAGVVRGFQVFANSGSLQYDGVVKIHVDKSTRYIYDARINPLGVPSENIQDVTSPPYILEYKFKLDYLLDDFNRATKFEQHVNIVVAWTMGERWKEMYQVIPLLHKSHLYDRHFHGITHQFVNLTSGQHAFYAIILDELLQNLLDPERSQQLAFDRYMSED
jgi:hypothetical protein